MRSGLVLVAVVVTLTVFAFQAITSPSPVTIVGTVVGPDAGPLYAFVRADSITDAMTITLRSG